MGLEHRGNRFSQDEDIIRLLDAKSKAAEITDEEDARNIVRQRTSDFATKSYVDSTFDSFATQEDVDNTYSGKAPASALGSSLLQLDDTGRIDPSQLPSLSTRGARWFKGPSGSSITSRNNIGDGGFFNSTEMMSSLVVNGSAMGNRPYYALGYGQIEVQGQSSDAIPHLYISTSAGLANAQYLSIGVGIPNWGDFYHVSIVPAGRTSHSGNTFTGNTSFFLSCRSDRGTSNFSNYLGEWGVLAIPMY